MDMIGHQAIRKDGYFVFDGVFTQQGKVGLVVGFGKEHLRAVVTALGHVVGEAGAEKSRNSGHAPRVESAS